MTGLTTTLIIELDDLDDTEVAELRSVITKTLAGFGAADVDPSAVFGWTGSLAVEFHRRLLAKNRPVQAKTIIAEAKAGGQCSREEVYLLGEYDADRSLSGFTKPVAGVMRAMQAEGLLPMDAANPMQPIYDPDNPSFQRAQGFRMPAELAPVFAEALVRE
jgi:hypothetical protein